MADKFALDTDKAQEMSRRLASVAQAGDGVPSGPSSSGDSLGTGALQGALSERHRLAQAFWQNESRMIKGSSDAFRNTITGLSGIDAELTRDAEEI